MEGIFFWLIVRLRIHVAVFPIVWAAYQKLLNVVSRYHRELMIEAFIKAEVNAVWQLILWRHVGSLLCIAIQHSQSLRVTV